jgi:MFS family permease
LIVACSIGIGGVIVASTFAKNFLTFTLIYSSCFGCCNGLAYTVPLKICWDYFPQKRGMVSGIIICGFGLGSFIFSFLSTLLANPHNLTADHKVDEIIFYGPEVAARVPGMLQKLALSWGIICSIAITCLKPL